MRNEYSFEYLGQTLDDAIGEAYDKVARILDLPYPGGPNVEKFALEGTPSYKMPQILNDDSCNFSFSGIKSHVNNIAHNASQRKEEINKYDLACSFQNCVTSHLVDKTKKALLKTNIKTLLLSGGVAANSYIRNSLKEMCDEIDVQMFMPEKKYCTDNAAMIGAAAYVLYEHKIFGDLSTNAQSNAKL